MVLATGSDRVLDELLVRSGAAFPFPGKGLFINRDNSHTSWDYEKCHIAHKRWRGFAPSSFLIPNPLLLNLFLPHNIPTVTTVISLWSKCCRNDLVTKIFHATQIKWKRDSGVEATHTLGIQVFYKYNFVCHHLPCSWGVTTGFFLFLNSSYSYNPRTAPSAAAWASPQGSTSTQGISRSWTCLHPAG